MIGEADIALAAISLRRYGPVVLVASPAMLVEISKGAGSWPPAGVDSVRGERHCPPGCWYLMSA